MKLISLLAVCATIQAFPLWFEPNQGQAHPSVDFLAHSPNGYVYFGRSRMAIREVHMDLRGARATAQADLEQPLGGITSYFIGRNEKDWHTGIPQYARIRYKDVYAGIDLVYYGNDRNVEYDFILKPGADPNQIQLAYNKPVRVEANGDLLIAGLRQKRPKVYQNGNEIACDYLVRGDSVQLALAEYDHSQPLTVDPVLEFSTYLGGVSQEGGYGLALDSQGNLYLAGGSQAPAQPGLDPFQQTSALINAPVVFKMTPDGRKILYYAFVGSGAWDFANGVAVDAAGSAVITGVTQNPNFPLKNAFQTTYKAAIHGAFYTKLSPDGKSLVYSSYIGGSNSEFGTGIALDAQGNAFITGFTQSNDFPVAKAFQPVYGGAADCYVAKIAPTGTVLWSTYLGGSSGDICSSIAVDADSNAYIGANSSSVDFPLRNAIQTTITPRNGFRTPLLIKLSPDGSIIGATFVGGPVAGSGSGIALDNTGNVYIAGYADSALATKDAFQAHSQSYTSGFLLEIDKTLQHVVFATYFGGSGTDGIERLAVDQTGSIYVAGSASSTDFPVKGSPQSFIGGGICQCDVFVAKFVPGAQSLIYSVVLGGHNGEGTGALAVDGSGDAYVTGWTVSSDFPAKNAFQSTYGGGGGDIFLAKISDNSPLAPSTLIPSPGHLSFHYTQGGASPAPQSVAVTGPAFTVGSTASWISTTVSGTTVIVSVNPTGLVPGTYNAALSLVPQSGAPASIDVTFTVLSPSPVLTSVDPVIVPIGASATVITIHGSGFTTDTVVQLNGLPFTPVTFIDANTLRISLPQSYLTVEYNQTITVKNPTSDVSNTLAVSVGTPAPHISAVTNAASFATGPVAPGEIVTIFGANLTDKVTFDNIPATLVYASPTQVSVTVPYAITGPATMLQVGSSAPVKLDVAPSAPGIFAAIPAGNNVLVLYATGCGQLTSDELPRCALPVTATVNDQPATVLYAGIAPGLVQGANQVNIQLPNGIASGPLTIVLTAGDTSSKPFNVTLP